MPYRSSGIGLRLLTRKLDANRTGYERDRDRYNRFIRKLAVIHLTFVSQPVGLDTRLQGMRGLEHSCYSLLTLAKLYRFMIIHFVCVCVRRLCLA